MDQRRDGNTVAQTPAPVVGLADGAVFAREFRVRRLLGKGGMGAVYLVEQLSTGRERALKLMDPQLVTDPKSRERFLQEARAGSHIESEHVVEVVDAGVDPDTGTPWLAMELLRGQTLAQRVAARGALAPAEAALVLRQLGHALRAAHKAGIVHRDVKPENVFLADSRRSDAACTVKMLDFGIAKLLQSARTSGSATSAVGSPMWMAPEQTGLGEVTTAADVWALGLLAFHIFTGHFYWKAAEAVEAPLAALITEILVGPLAPASVRAQELAAAERLPGGFDAWFAKCTARDPQERFPGAGDAIDALQPLLAAWEKTVLPAAATVPRTVVKSIPTGTPAATEALAATLASSPNVPLPPRPRGRARLWLAGLGLLVVGAGIWAWLASSDRGPTRGERAARRETRTARVDERARPAAPPASSAPEVAAPARADADTSVPPAGVAAALAVDAAAAAPSSEDVPVAVAAAPPSPDFGAGGRAEASTTVRAPPSGRSRSLTPAAREFLDQIVRLCWNDALQRGPMPSISVDITVQVRGGSNYVRVEPPSALAEPYRSDFRRCVATRGSYFAFTVQPVEPEIVVRARLAGTR